MKRSKMPRNKDEEEEIPKDHRLREGDRRRSKVEEKREIRVAQEQAAVRRDR